MIQIEIIKPKNTLHLFNKEVIFNNILITSKIPMPHNNNFRVLVNYTMIIYKILIKL